MRDYLWRRELLFGIILGVVIVITILLTLNERPLPLIEIDLPPLQVHFPA